MKMQSHLISTLYIFGGILVVNSFKGLLDNTDGDQSHILEFGNESKSILNNSRPWISNPVEGHPRLGSIPTCCGRDGRLIMTRNGDYVCLNEAAGATWTEFGNCTQNILINYPTHKIFQVMENGELQVGPSMVLDFSHPIWMSVTPLDFMCLDTLSSLDAGNVGRDLKDMNVLFYCNIFMGGYDNYILLRRMHGIIIGVQGIISLLITLPYLLLWNLQNVSGWAQCSFFMALGVDDVFIGIYNFLYEDELRITSSAFCLISGVALKITELACFSTWATTHFDMLRTVWTCNRKMDKSVTYIRMTVYCFTGWGIPVIIGVGELIWTHFHRDELYGPIDMKFLSGDRRCEPPLSTSLPTVIVKLTFFVLSIVFLAIMVIVIRKHQKDIKMATSTVKKRYGKQLKTSFKLTIFVGTPFVVISVMEMFIGELIAQSWVLIGFRLVLLFTLLYVGHAFAYNRKNLSRLLQKYPRLKCKVRTEYSSTNWTRPN